MPIKSTIVDGIIYTEVSGEINYGQVIMQIDFIFTLKDKIVCRYELHDHSNTEGINLTTDDMRKIASYSTKVKNIFKHSFVAIYAPTDLTFGIASMFQTFYEIEEHTIIVEIFRDKEEAKQFLMKQKIIYG